MLSGQLCFLFILCVPVRSLHFGAVYFVFHISVRQLRCGRLGRLKSRERIGTQSLLLPSSKRRASAAGGKGLGRLQLPERNGPRMSRMVGVQHGLIRGDAQS